jgi:hypothetical protein
MNIKTQMQKNIIDLENRAQLIPCRPIIVCAHCRCQARQPETEGGGDRCANCGWHETVEIVPSVIGAPRDHTADEPYPI